MPVDFGFLDPNDDDGLSFRPRLEGLPRLLERE